MTTRQDADRAFRFVFICTVLWLLVTFAAALSVGFAIVRGLEGIEKNGLRYYIERTWEGPQVAS